jgi:hypothetical protein
VGDVGVVARSVEQLARRRTEKKLARVRMLTDQR